MATADTTGQLGSSIQSLLSAMASGNSQAAQEAIRQFNLTYTDTVANTYGQNFGVGQPGPPGTPTLAAGQATGSTRLYPRFHWHRRQPDAVEPRRSGNDRPGCRGSDRLLRRTKPVAVHARFVRTARPRFVRQQHVRHADQLRVAVGPTAARQHPAGASDGLERQPQHDADHLGTASDRARVRAALAVTRPDALGV